MKRILWILLGIAAGALVICACAQGSTAKDKTEDIRLIIRGDDIGSFHAANVGCIKAYREGIMRSVEIMVPCPWYPEAVKWLNENPGLDVGVHLVMTSEWEAMKWRPLTGISSITDEGGYFFPMVWPNEKYPPSKAFRESGWTLEDVERELRAQIKVAKRDIKSLSHVTAHMGFTSADPAIDSLVTALAKSYDLHIDMEAQNVHRFRYDKDREASIEDQVGAFVSGLEQLEGGTYLYVEHPAMDTPEMESIGHAGNNTVGKDRQAVTDILTHPRLKEAVVRLGIELISYADLKNE